MNRDLLFYANLSIRNLGSFGHQNILLLTAAETPELCDHLQHHPCGYQTAVVPHASWRRIGVLQNHFYILFLQRWRLILRIIRWNYTVLSLDMDIFWTSDPLGAIASASLSANAAFACDTPASRRTSDSSLTSLNSGVMFARPGAVGLFREVVQRLFTRFSGPPQRFSRVWPQSVLNEVVQEWRQNRSQEQIPIKVLGHNIISRICGRRLKAADTRVFWNRSVAANCTLNTSQAGFHAQMVHPETRAALWDVAHPQSQQRLRSDTSVAMSATLTRWTCICRHDECRVLSGFDSYRTAIKSCKDFRGANPSA